jgi:hypothetical protein
MRKMITTLNAMLRDDVAWQPQSAWANITVAHSITSTMETSQEPFRKDSPADILILLNETVIILM